MKDKDLWDTRELPLPRHEKEVHQDVRGVRSARKSEGSTLADWGTGGEFWKEWDSEFDATAAANGTKQSASEEVAPTKHAEDPEVHLEPWAAQLAYHERKLEKEGTVDYGLPFRRQELLVDRTKEYARVLQSTFRKYIEIFNQARQSPAHAMQLYKVSRTEEDFLLFRNGVKLIVSAQHAGKISFSFNQFLTPLSQNQTQAHIEIDAVWGPFDQLHWTYKGERVQLLDIVRYFIAELAFQSFVK